MKFAGYDFDKPNEEFLVLVRNGRDLVIKAKAVLDYTIFDGLCPRPKPKKIKKVGGEEKYLIDAPDYRKALDTWAGQRTAWMIVESLKATPELVWETIVPNEPSTWGNYEQELRAAYFTEQEIIHIVNLAVSACGINENKLEEARKRFLAGQEVESEE